MLQYKEGFGVYHWDTFDNETFLKKKNWSTGEEAIFDTKEEAVAWVRESYGDRLNNTTGADRVEVVDCGGNIVWRHNVC